MKAPRPTQLAICIDDVGLSPGINEAAVALALQGRLSAFSCMVGAPAWRDAVRRLAEAGPALRDRGVDIGLHLDLTEHPLRMTAQPLGRLILLSQARRLDPIALRDEVARQFDAFEAALGRLPDHVDGHQHVHQFPQVREALLAEWRTRIDASTAPRPWLRDTRRARPRRLGEAFKPWLIERLGAAALRREAAALGLRQNGRLLGVYDFDVARLPYAERLRGWLAQARDGDLLMCHAATSADASDPLQSARVAEWRTLSDPAWSGWLDEAGVVVARLR